MGGTSLEQSPAYGERVTVRTWYGARGQVELQGPFWHLAGLWGIDVPHPPLVNLIVRHGLPLEAKRRPSFDHEVGHLQMLPAAMLASIVILAQAWRTDGLRWRDLPRLWAGHHALWEMLAEAYVMRRHRERYRHLYRHGPHPGLASF